MHLLALFALIGAGTALAKQPSVKNLFVTSYAGTLSTLQLSTVGDGHYQLQNASVNLGCQPSPSELVVDKQHGALFCIGEAAAGGNGSLTAYNIMNGTLAQRANTAANPGPVYGALYGGPSAAVRGLALAHYGDAGLSMWNVHNDLTMDPINPNVTFPTPNPPGPVAESQAVSHPHSAILDPTGQYLVVPDLGADLVHVFGFDNNTGALKEAGQPLKTKAGDGPRFAAFSVKGNATYMYLVTELSAILNGYTVTYAPNNGGMTFQQMYSSDTVGGQKTQGKNAPAQIRIAPDNKWLIISNRNDSSFTIPNNNPTNTTALPSDSLAVYGIQANGSLAFTQLFPAGGSFARSIDINKKGNLVAVGLQNSGRVVVLPRNTTDGTLSNPIAYYETPTVGQVTSVHWDE